MLRLKEAFKKEVLRRADGKARILTDMICYFLQKVQSITPTCSKYFGSYAQTDMWDFLDNRTRFSGLLYEDPNNFLHTLHGQGSSCFGKSHTYLGGPRGFARSIVRVWGLRLRDH